MAIRKASKQQSKLRIDISGPSGSGKSYGALLIAKGLVGNYEKICVLDTENGSADLYSDLGGYSVLPFKSPYSPQRYMNAIDMIQKDGFECIIIDSFSHAWAGEGGLLEIHQSFGGRFQDWAKSTPIQNKLIQAILGTDMHVICTTRRKHEWHVENVNNKIKVKKVGTKEVQRDDVEYEFTVSFMIDNDNHLTTIGKDRTQLFCDPVPFLITEETGILLKIWNNNGEKKDVDTE